MNRVASHDACWACRRKHEVYRFRDSVALVLNASWAEWSNARSAQLRRHELVLRSVLTVALSPSVVPIS